MKFLADMGISPHTVSFLKNLGYDTVHLSEQDYTDYPMKRSFEKLAMKVGLY